MKEYRIVCTRKMKTPKGTETFDRVAPIIGGGNALRSIVKTIEEAEANLELAKTKGAEYDARSRKTHKVYKDTNVITQTNFRIESREVTEWTVE